MKNKLKNLVLLILIIAVVCGIGFLIVNAARSGEYNKNAKNPIVTFDVEGYGQVKIELYPDYAPNTVTYFIKLIENGYYNDKVFFGTDGYSVAGGMIKNDAEASAITDQLEDIQNQLQEGVDAETIAQNTSTEEQKSVIEDEPRVSDIDTSVTPYVEDDSNSDETTDYKISIDGEFVANGYNDNTLRFEKGVVGLYRNNYSGLTNESYNSGTSIFFIETREDSSLNGQYAAFGKVIEGMDIIEQLVNLPVEEEESSETIGEDSTSIKYYSELPVIKSATVDTFGVDYGMPKYEEAFDYNAYINEWFLQNYNY